MTAAVCSCPSSHRERFCDQDSDDLEVLFGDQSVTADCFHEWISGETEDHLAEKTKLVPPSRIPPYLTWVCAAAALPFGIWLGTILTIERADGSKSKISLPDNAMALVSSKGDVAITMEGASPEPISTKAEPMPIAKEEPTAKKENGIDGPVISDALTLSLRNSTPSKDAARSSSRDDGISDALLKKAVDNTTQLNESTYRGYPFSVWLELLRKERDEELSVVASNALFSLADTSEQKSLAIKTNLEKSIHIGGARWLASQCGHLSQYFTTPELDLILNELDVGNYKSKHLISTMICSAIPDFETRYSSLLRGRQIDWSKISEEKIRNLVSLLGNYATEADSEMRQLCLDAILHVAVLSDISYATLPPPVQERSRKAWLDRLERGFRTNRKANDKSGSSYHMEQLPYWRSLPSEEKNVSLFVSDLLNQETQVGLPEQVVWSVLGEAKHISEDESTKVKSVLVASLSKCLADAFRNPTSSISIRPIIVSYPLLLEWLKNTKVLVDEDYSRAVKHVRDIALDIQTNKRMSGGDNSKEVAKQLGDILGVDTKSQAFLDIYTEIN